MTQTLAIFHEAYRNLNSKKLFWIVLVISGLSVAAFACVGINQRGIKLLIWQIDNELFNSRYMAPAAFYKQIFVQIGIGLWLSWLASILALISTAGIFPDLITSGSIDLFVSKPISRLRLFITEYVAGLLFVTLQVAVFSLASFLVIGFRGGAWEPGLFVAIPLTVCFFSYLFAVCVLLGVLTRSTVAALLLTLLFWFFVFAVGSAENTLLMFQTMHKEGVDLAMLQAEQAGKKPKARGASGTAQTAKAEEESPPAEGDKEDGSEKNGGKVDGNKEDGSHALDVAYRIVYGVKTVLPKTTETISLLERLLVNLAELPQRHDQPDTPQQRRIKAVQQEMVETLRGRSLGWVLGTSLGFELFVLAGAAFLFCRRDY